MLNVFNFAQGTVSTGYDASATSIVLTTGHGARFPVGPFRAVWWNSTDYPNPADDPNREIVEVTTRSTDTLTIIRGMETSYGGLAASTKNTGGATYGFALVATVESTLRNRINNAGAGAYHTEFFQNGAGAMDAPGTAGTRSVADDGNSGQVFTAGTGSTDSSGVVFSDTKLKPDSTHNVVMEAMVKVDQLSDGTDTFRFEMGFDQAQYPKDNTMFISHDNTSANWLCKNKSGSTTTTDSGVAVSTSSYATLGIVWKVASIDFYINRVKVATHTTNIPSALGWGPGIELIKSAGSLTRAFRASFWTIGRVGPR